MERDDIIERVILLILTVLIGIFLANVNVHEKEKAEANEIVVYEEISYYETNYYDSSKILQEYHGAIMKVNLQNDYDVRVPPYEQSYYAPDRYDSSGDLFEKIEVTKMGITLQAEFDLDRNYSSFKDTGYLKFAADYRHGYYTIGVDIKPTVRDFLPKPSGGLVIDASLNLVYDGGDYTKENRKNTIEFDFR